MHETAYCLSAKLWLRLQNEVRSLQPKLTKIVAQMRHLSRHLVCDQTILLRPQVQDGQFEALLRCLQRRQRMEASAYQSLVQTADFSLYLLQRLITCDLAKAQRA